MIYNHIKNLVNLGYLVDESTANLIENLNENNFYKLVEGLKERNIFLVNNKLINDILAGDVKIIKEFTPLKKFTVQDFVKNLNERYSALQNILIKRVEFSDLVTINKLSSGYASIIGLVKEKTENEENFVVVLEDSTGDVQTLIPKNLGEKLALDDTVAVSGKFSNKIFFVSKLVYPDVPIRAVNYTLESVKVAFLEEEKDYNANYVFYKNQIKDKIKDKVYRITNPCLVEIAGVVILVLFDFNPLEILRKRYVNIENTDFLVEPVPDIVFTDKEINTNYKGISILSLNKLIDLKTREIVII